MWPRVYQVMLPGVFGNQTRLDGLLMGDESVAVVQVCLLFFFFVRYYDVN